MKAVSYILYFLGYVAAWVFMALAWLALWALVANAQSPFYSEDEQTHALRFWPKSVEVPPTLRFYKKSMHGQQVIAGRNTHYVHINVDGAANVPPYSASNPNRVFPWRVSGGFHDALDWQSKVAIALPDGESIKGWWEELREPAGIAYLARWEYPEGTKFFDLLTANGKVFELRSRVKSEGEWFNDVLFKSDDLPKGYFGTDRKCHECHNRAGTKQGSSSLRIRGGDENFSFPVLLEKSGIPEFNPDLKVIHKKLVEIQKGETHADSR